MFEEVLIQIGVQLLCKQSKKVAGGLGGEAPHDVRRSDDSNREELVMLMMREAKSKRMRKAKASKSRIHQRKAAEAKTPPAEEELGMERMRKAKAKKPPKAA